MKNNDPRVFIEHIFENLEDITDFSRSLTKISFLKDKLRQKAIIGSMEVIGEAVKNLPESFRKNYPKIPWSRIAGTRDRIIHHYFGIDLDIIWQILKKDVPDLKKQIKKIKNQLR